MGLVEVMAAGSAYGAVAVMVMGRLRKRRPWYRKLAIGMAWPIVGLLIWWVDD